MSAGTILYFILLLVVFLVFVSFMVVEWWSNRPPKMSWHCHVYQRNGGGDGGFFILNRLTREAMQKEVIARGYVIKGIDDRCNHVFLQEKYNE